MSTSLSIQFELPERKTRSLSKRGTFQKFQCGLKPDTNIPDNFICKLTSFAHIKTTNDSFFKKYFRRFVIYNYGKKERNKMTENIQPLN